jgi:hypothetical protein
MAQAFRATQSQLGRPLALHMQVGAQRRRQSDHAIFWSRASSRTADQYNSAVHRFQEPCLRRYLEFTGNFGAALGLSYVTSYSPPAIQSKPTRVWILYRGKEQICTFTNATEGWLVMLGLKAFENDYDLSLCYIDLKA